MSLGKSIGAVAAGFATTFLLSVGIDAVLHGAGVYPPNGIRMADGLFVLATAYRIAATIAGGWVTARLAPAPARRGVRLAVVLGAIGTVAALGGVGIALTHPELGPLWYAVALVVTAIPCTWAGGRLRLRQAAALA